MNAIEEIKGKLQKYPDTRYEFGASHIRVLPASENGFSVELRTTRNHYTIQYNGWHETFTDLEEAMNCFAFGLSTECRLKEYRRSRVAHKWTVEYREADRWIEDSTTGILVYPFWGKRQIRYLQNNLVL